MKEWVLNWVTNNLLHSSHFVFIYFASFFLPSLCILIRFIVRLQMMYLLVGSFSPVPHSISLFFLPVPLSPFLPFTSPWHESGDGLALLTSSPWLFFLGVLLLLLFVCPFLRKRVLSRLKKTLTEPKKKLNVSNRTIQEKQISRLVAILVMS